MASFAAASSNLANADAGTSFIVSKLKRELASRGANGIMGLGRKFKIMVRRGEAERFWER